MNLEEVEATQDKEDSVKAVTANILKEVRQNFASMKQDAMKDKYSMLKHLLKMKLKISLSLKD